MEVAHNEVETLSATKYILKGWQLRDSLQGLLDQSPLFTQYRYSVEHNEVDPSTKEPFALTFANAMCQYLMSCKKTYRFAELIKSSVSEANKRVSLLLLWLLFCWLFFWLLLLVLSSS